MAQEPSIYTNERNTSVFIYTCANRGSIYEEISSHQNESDSAEQTNLLVHHIVYTIHQNRQYNVL